MFATAALAACAVVPPNLERQQINGKITLLRVQDVPGAKTPPQDTSDFNVVVAIDTAPNLVLAFNLRGNRHRTFQRGMLDLLRVALEGNREAIIDYAELESGVGLIVGISLTGESATPFVRVREVPNVVITANDPIQVTGRLDPSVLANAPATPPEFQNKGAHAAFGATQWAPITQAELPPGASQELLVTISEPSLLLAKVDWVGSAVPVLVQVVKDGATLANGSAFVVPPDQGTVTIDAELDTPGDATVVVSNPSTATVSVEIVVGTVPLALGGISP